MSRLYRNSISLLTLAALAVTVLAVDARADYGAQWSVLEISGTKPSARTHHTMVYDPVNNRVILYGGEDPTVKDDVWVLHLTGTPYWEQASPEADDPESDVPPPLHGHSAVYDAQNARMLLFNGRIDDGISAASFPDGVRELTWNNGFRWNRLFNFPTNNVNTCGVSLCGHPYERRTHSAAAIKSNQLYVMGGQVIGMGPMHDIWSHTLGATNWGWRSGAVWATYYQQCEPQSCIDRFIPTQRFYHSMIVDSYGRIIIFGGQYEMASQSNAFYTVDGSSWTYLGSVPDVPHNFSRELHVAIFDPVEGRMVVVGGIIRNGDNETLTSAVTSLPLPEFFPDFEPPSAGNVNGDTNNAWVLHNSTCENDPGPMAGHAAVYDSQGDRILVFGGVMDSNNPPTPRSNDVWILDIRDHTAPAVVTISPAQVGKVSSTISWTAPGDDGSVGTACRYDLRRSTSNITNDTQFYAATQLPTDVPQSAGSSECGTTGPNNPCTWYYYALKTIDEAGNTSAMSNVLAIKSKCGGTSYACPGGGSLVAELPSTPSAAAVEYMIRTSNPASGSTTLFVGVPGERQGEAMEMAVYDVAGKRVRMLVEESARAGEHNVTWDHRNDAGTRVAAGVYFARLRIGNEARTHKIVIPIR